MPDFLRALTAPLTTAPSRWGRQLSEMIDPVATRDQLAPTGQPMTDAWLRNLRSMIAGGMEGVGDLASDATSPASLLTMAAGVSPTLGRMSRVGRMERALQATDAPLRTLTADTAAWAPKGGTAGLHDARMAERELGIYDVPNNPRAQELERVRKLIEEAYLRGEITQ